METPGQVQLLIIGQPSSEADALLRALENGDQEVATHRLAAHPGLAAEVKQKPWDLALIFRGDDLSSPEDAIALLSGNASDRPIIVVTESGEDSAAASLLDSDAAHLLPPDNPRRLRTVLWRELKACSSRRQLKGVLEELRAVVDNIAIGVALISPQFVILNLNRKMREWFPAIDPEVTPVCYRAFNDPLRKVPCSNCPTRLTLQDGKTHQATTETPCGDKTMHFRVVSSAIHDEMGRVKAAIALVEDITAQVQHERLLQQHQAQLHDILERTPMGVLVVGRDKRIRWANAMVLKMAGVKSLVDIVGRECTNVMCPAEDGQCPVLDLGQTVEHSERSLRGPEGAIRPILKSVVPIVLDGEDVLLETFVDISAHKDNQPESLQSQKLESIGQLAAGIAHEINTPIQYIGDNIRFLKEALQDQDALWAKLDEFDRAVAEGSISPELPQQLRAAREEADLDFFRESSAESIAQVLEGVERVATIVRALKNFAHPSGASAASTDLNAVIGSTVTVCRNEWKYIAEVALDLQEDLPLVTCVPGQVNQVFLNMIVNAAHAIAAAEESSSGGLGKITITSRSRENQVTISIADTGAGIPEDIRGRIFDPFFTTKSVGQGTGQGLAIAHDVIVNKHGGSIDVDSAVGRGTTFYIALPIDGVACLGNDAA